MNANLRSWAADATARARWLAREAKAGDVWPTLEDAFARATLANVFSLLADGHAQAAEDLRRTLRPPAGRAAGAGPHVDPSSNLRPRGGPSQERHDANQHPTQGTP